MLGMRSHLLYEVELLRAVRNVCPVFGAERLERETEPSVRAADSQRRKRLRLPGLPGMARARVWGQPGAPHWLSVFEGIRKPVFLFLTCPI